MTKLVLDELESGPRHPSVFRYALPPEGRPSRPSLGSGRARYAPNRLPANWNVGEKQSTRRKAVRRYGENMRWPHGKAPTLHLRTVRQTGERRANSPRTAPYPKNPMKKRLFRLHTPRALSGAGRWGSSTWRPNRRTLLGVAKVTAADDPKVKEMGGGECQVVRGGKMWSQAGQGRRALEQDKKKRQLRMHQNGKRVR